MRNDVDETLVLASLSDAGAFVRDALVQGVSLRPTPCYRLGWLRLPESDSEGFQYITRSHFLR